jgi:hypothetical protein
MASINYQEIGMSPSVVARELRTLKDKMQKLICNYEKRIADL